MRCDVGTRPRDAHEVHIYVDGSGGSHRDPYVTWACVVLAISDDGSYNVTGYIIGNVITMAQHGVHVGISEADSGSAELSAQIWARL